MFRIDAHTHCVGDHPATVALLAELDLKLLNIGVAEEGLPWREHLKLYRDLAAKHPDRFAWVTTFGLPRWDDPHWAEGVVAQLDADFAAGAIGCKVWKDVGMRARRPDGSYLMIDDPVYEPIFAHLEKLRRPLLTHIAEPLACWKRLHPGDPHAAYYRRHPEWYMGDKVGVPSHARLMAARDAVVAGHPKLPVIGAHLGSLEYDLKEIAARLERYPNFAVDTAGRMRDLLDYEPRVVRQFLERYQDRVLWSTDLVQMLQHSTLSPAQLAAAHESMRCTYRSEFNYYSTSARTRLFGIEAQPLGLPQKLLQKLCVDNARRWYPGV